MEPISDFKLPKYWPRVWALDIDRENASVLWCAHDRESDTLYVYSELVMPRYELALIADAIKKRAGRVPGLFDHLARNRSPQAGQQIIHALLDLHLDVFTAQVDPDAANAEIARRLSTKRLKVFSTCPQWLAQYRAYRRDKEGHIVEEPDGLMKAMHLLAIEAPQIAPMDNSPSAAGAQDDWADETRNKLTGY